MANRTLSAMFEDVFSFLVDEYSFNILISKDEDWGYTFRAVNDTTGVEIIYEFTQAYLNIMLYRLIDGKIINNTMKAIKNNELINGFNLDLIIQIKNPSDMIQPAYVYGEDSEFYKPEVGLRNYLLLFANNLRTYATGILSGDFEIFILLDENMKEKYKDYYKNRK